MIKLSIKLTGIATAVLVPALGLAARPVVPASAPSRYLLPAMDNILPPATLSQSQNLGPVNPSQTMSFGVVLPSQNPNGLTAMAQAVSNPHSPDYHHFLSHAQAMAEFGPSPALVNQLVSGFQQAGFQAVQQNQMIKVSGTVAQVNQLFNTQMTQYQQGSDQYQAPNSALSLPDWLRGAESLTGFAQGTPSTGFTTAKHLSAQFAPKSAMLPTPAGSTSTGSNDGYTVTVSRVTNGSRTPGLAVRYLVTVTQNGQPVTDPIAVASLQGPFAGASSLVQWYTNPPAGQILMDFTMSQQQSISMLATFAITDPNTGASLGTVSVQLPSASFVGPNAKTAVMPEFAQYGITAPLVAPWNPSNNNVDSAFDAAGLVNQTLQYDAYGITPTIGVYTAGGISSNGNVSGISFSVPEGDANLFANQFNLPAESYAVGYVGPNSEPDATYGGIEGEMSLDLQMMETSAPGAHIVVYSAGSLRSALNQVDAQDQVNVFSISYGGGEQVEEFFSPGAQASWDELAAMANLEGITISVSAGDSGAYSGAEYLGYDGVPNAVALAPQPSYPANSSYVSALGGTEDAVGTTGQINQAAMWGGDLGMELSHSTLLQFLSQQNMIASGGISTIEPVPFYQSALTPSLSGRMTPDFSFPASVVTPGYFAYFDGAPNLSGGTSAAAPLFAGYIADLAEQIGPLGNINPAIYQLSNTPAFRLPAGAILTSVAFGMNGAYTESPRDNAVTGLGQLNVDALQGALGGFSRAVSASSHAS